ncbi:MAG TPA: DUF1214 domain-containing protein [Myxococcota bacterium]|nr:DUF1214 domain-containing protein [Myxococcota bacterium]
MSDAAKQRLLSGQAWEDFCEQLKEAGRGIDRWGEFPSELDRVEWYRFLTRIVRNGLERFVENCEPDRPRLRDAPWRQSINVQCPDQDHLLSEFVDGSHEYRIRGQRGTVPYFVMAAWSAKQPADLASRDWAGRGVDGLKEFDTATLQTTSFLMSDDIRFEPDGSFEVILSQRKPASGSWLALRPDSVGVLVRVVYHDRAQETPPTMRIERLDEPRPRPIEAGELAAGLAKAGQGAVAYAELVRAWWQDNLGQRPNRLRFSRQTYLSNGGVPDRHFAFGTWQKRPDEALVLHFRPPECEYWIFQLCNLWQENLDNYEDGQGYVTKFSARPEADGSIRIVVAERDPKVGGNWVDSFGHTAGIMGLRLIKTSDPPPVTLHRVPLRELERTGFAGLAPEAAIKSGELTD